MRARSWIVKSFLGWLLGVPAIALLALLGEAVGIGGSQALVGAGILQAFVARGRIGRPIVWAIASAVGWSLAGLTASRADSLLRAHAIRGVAGALLYLGLVALGGVVLGVVTAPALRPPAVLSR